MTTFDQHQQNVETQYNVVGDLTIHQTPQRTVPLQRPPRAEHFVAREKELAQLLTDLQPGRVVTLCGPGGIGKSALAAEAVWTLAPNEAPPDRFPDGIIFHSFAGQPQAEVALETIARTFGQAPKPTPAAAAQRTLAGRQLLLLLDSAEDADNLSAVLEVRGGCGVLVTSRSRSDAQAERQDIEPLAAAEAVKLLQAWGRGQATDEVAVQRISDLVGRLPLAVRLVGRYLEQTGETAAEYLEWLEETPIEALSQGEHREENVARLLEHSLAQVSESARQVLAVAGLLALAPFDRAIIGAALEMTSGKVRRALNHLISYGLLRREGDRYEVNHALVHTYAQQRLVVSDKMIEGLVTYYTDLFNRYGFEAAEFSQLDAVRIHVMAIVERCREQAMWPVMPGLAWAVSRYGSYLVNQDYGVERLIVAKAGLEAARKLEQELHEATFLGIIGETLFSSGQAQKAIPYFEQALAINLKIGDRNGEGHILRHLGQAFISLGQVERAIEYFERSLPITRETGDYHSEGTNLGILGGIYLSLGQVERGIEFQKQALTVHAGKDRTGEARMLSSLGIICRRLGQIGQAINYYQQA
ncbi:MAG: tetratricopeptide repeat protein, partial [Anaerolineae bacterium]|nr:tetratricopeptide repeat protein [Anaerolineae bacterium]